MVGHHPVQALFYPMPRTELLSRKWLAPTTVGGLLPYILNALHLPLHLNIPFPVYRTFKKVIDCASFLNVKQWFLLNVLLLRKWGKVLSRMATTVEGGGQERVHRSVLRRKHTK